MGFGFSKSAVFDFVFPLLDTGAQCAGRRGLFAAGIKVRKAVLTDCSSGKYSATSGESSTRFVPAR